MAKRTDRPKHPELSCWQKFERGQKHAGEAFALQMQWRDASIDTKTGVGEIRPMPPLFPLVVGDAVQCFRQSLDHLAFALVASEKQNLTDEQAKRIYFPLVPADVRRVSISTAAAAAIKGALEADMRRPTGVQVFRLLRELSNVDRHRLIPFVVPASVRFIPVDPAHAADVTYSLAIHFGQNPLARHPADVDPADGPSSATNVLQRLDRIEHGVRNLLLDLESMAIPGHTQVSTLNKLPLSQKHRFS